MALRVRPEYWEKTKGSKLRLKRGFHKFSFLGNFEGEIDGNNMVECKVSVPSNLGRSEKIIRMSGKIYRDENQLREAMKIKNNTTTSVQVEFSPYIGFKRNDGKYVGVGDYVGMGLKDWLSSNMNEIWVKGDQGIVVAQEKFGLLITKLLKTIYRQHLKGLSLGFHCDYLYIEYEHNNFTLPERKIHGYQLFGMWEDLQEVRKLVNLAAGTSGGDNNVMLFKDSFPPGAPANVEEMRVLSYMICHTPLFWSMTERYEFANFYNSLRNHFPKVDEVLKMNYSRYNLRNWDKKIKNLAGLDRVESTIQEVYENLPNPMFNPNVFMQFIRILNHHYFEPQFVSEVNLTTIDAKILSIFPGAFSKTWGEIVSKMEKLPLSASQLIDGLKKHGLWYGEDSDPDKWNG